MTGEQLTNLRVAAGLTKQALGIKAGFPAKNAIQRIWDYENGKSKITMATATLFTLLLTPKE